MVSIINVESNIEVMIKLVLFVYGRTDNSKILSQTGNYKLWGETAESHCTRFDEFSRIKRV